MDRATHLRDRRRYCRDIQRLALDGESDVLDLRVQLAQRDGGPIGDIEIGHPCGEFDEQPSWSLRTSTPLAPSSANRSAIARPIPDDAPVTSAVESAKRDDILISQPTNAIAVK